MSYVAEGNFCRGRKPLLVAGFVFSAALQIYQFIDESMSKILMVSVAGAILLVAGSISYHYLYTVPKQQTFAQCVQTYPMDWEKSLSVGFYTSPAALCQKGYSLTQFTQLISEKTRLAAEELKSQGADLTSQSVKESVREKVKRDVQAELSL